MLPFKAGCEECLRGQRLATISGVHSWVLFKCVQCLASGMGESWWRWPVKDRCKSFLEHSHPCVWHVSFHRDVKRSVSLVICLWVKDPFSKRKGSLESNMEKSSEALTRMAGQVWMARERFFWDFFGLGMWFSFCWMFVSWCYRHLIHRRTLAPMFFEAKGASRYFDLCLFLFDWWGIYEIF